jgi:flagellar hook-associated protein 3 FlgL
MRTTDAVSYRSLLDNINTLNERMLHASEQVSSGRKLSHLHDAPADNAEMLQLKGQLADLDQYQTNADNGSFFLQVAESTLNSVYDLITTVFTRGSAAANSLNDPASLSTLASEIRSLRDQIFSLANTQVRGRYLFAGSQVNSPAFSILGDTVTYQGDTIVNTIDISSNLDVQANVPGSSVFDPVFASVDSLLLAVEGGNTNAIKAALGQFSSTLATVGQVRASLGVDLAKLQDSEVARLDQQLNIQTRQAHIGDADMAAAIAELNQTQSALQAALSAGSLIGQKNLFDYIG